MLDLTRERFGTGFGPHRFRHALATTAALRDPGHPALAASVLGISAAVLEQHYNRGRQVQATSPSARSSTGGGGRRCGREPA